MSPDLFLKVASKSICIAATKFYPVGGRAFANVIAEAILSPFGFEINCRKNVIRITAITITEK